MMQTDYFSYCLKVATSWLVEGPLGTGEQRALCLQLGDAYADLENQRA